MIKRYYSNKARMFGVCLTGRRNTSLKTWMQTRKHNETTSMRVEDKMENTEQKKMFVPKSKPASSSDIEELQIFVRSSKKLFVLTGAGLSTESGIPDYRSEGVGLYARSTNRPVQYTDFVKQPDIRQRVMCLDCPAKLTRPQMQELIRSTNPNWSAQSNEMAPDADVHLTADQVEGFKVPPCPNCGGRLKPEITFFGDNVPKPVVEFVHQRVRESDSILLAGTSLQVYSGYRFVNAAKEQKKPIAILNIGPTRADKLADLIVNARCGDVLPKIKITR